MHAWPRLKSTAESERARAHYNTNVEAEKLICSMLTPRLSRNPTALVPRAQLAEQPHCFGQAIRRQAFG